MYILMFLRIYAYLRVFIYFFFFFLQALSQQEYIMTNNNNYMCDITNVTGNHNSFRPITGRDKGRMRIRIRMADTDADEKIRMRKCGWGIKRGWENADGG